MNAAERAYLATREVGLHIYGHLLGIWCTQLDVRTCRGTLELRPYAIDDWGLPALGVLASLGDMAMQTSLLSAYPAKRLITRTLNVRRVGVQGCGTLEAVARVVHAGEGYAMSEGSIVDERAEPVAFLSATFVPIPQPSAWRPLPWELALTTPTDDELQRSAPLAADDRRSAESLQRLIEQSDISYRGFLGISNDSTSPGLRWPLQPHLLNRAGEAQGGAIFGAHGEAFKDQLPKGAVPIEQTVTFFRSVRSDAIIESDVVYAGKRFASRVTRMREEDGSLASMSVTEFEIRGR